MRVLFTADIHVKLGQKSVPVDWAKNRYNLLWADLKELQSQCDMFIVGGDVFDKLPSMEELEVYFQFLEHCVIPTIIIPGNHESVKKSTTFFTNLKSVTARLNPLVRIIDDYHTESGMDFIPYNKLKEYHPQDIDFHSDILVSHFRAEIPPHVKPEVPLELFSRWKVVLAGDLHSYDNCQLNILYPGSPITTSFHRSKVDTGVILFDTNTLDHEFVKLELPQLLRKTVKAGEPTPRTDYDHTVYEVEGDMAELSDLADHELIDKKVSKKSNDSALLLNPEMTLVEEVREYLAYILTLQEDTIDKVLQELQDNVGTLE